MTNRAEPHQTDNTGSPDGPLIVFAGGGSGGHLFPSLAVADAIGALRPDARFCFFATDRPIDAEILGATDHETEFQPVRPLTRKPWRWPGFTLAAARCCGRARAYFTAHSPALVIGSGGFASAPPVWVAARMNIPTAILNPDRLRGRANCALSGRVRAAFVQWAESRDRFPRDTEVFDTGCPVRRQFGRATRNDGISAFGLDAERRTLLVTGASQGARSINRTMIRLAVWLAELRGWQVLHVTGTADLESVRGAYVAAGVAHCCVACTSRMAEALAAADLVVSRAGASALAEMTAVGRPSILVPYPFDRNQHQLANARMLEERGAAVICEDACNDAITAKRIQSAVGELMGNNDALNRMGEAARAMGRPDAAACVARLCLELAGYPSSRPASMRVQKNEPVGRYTKRTAHTPAGHPLAHSGGTQNNMEIRS